MRSRNGESGSLARTAYINAVEMDPSNPQRIVRSVLLNGFLYMVSYDKTKVYKINIENPADVKEIPLGFTTNFTCNDDYYRSGSIYLVNIEDWIVGSDFLINTEDRVFKKANNAPWTYTSTPLFQYGPYLFSFGGYHGDSTRQNLFLWTPYLIITESDGSHLSLFSYIFYKGA